MSDTLRAKFHRRGKIVSNPMPRLLRNCRGWAGIRATLWLALIACGHGQSGPADGPTVTMFPHSQSSRYWISGQDNIIFQWHPSFGARYSGPNSFGSQAEQATSNVATVFLGLAVTGTTEIFLDVETADGGGVSDALGLAGFINADVVRNPQLGPAPYLARAMIRHVIPLSREAVEAERGPFALATSLPVRRLELRAGKFGMADFFDLNGVGSDSHYQFLNWTTVNNGAYDYAADTRGYTAGILIMYYDRNCAFRFAESLMPTVANGTDLDWNLRRARAENFELELRPRWLANHATTLRLLSFLNHANMGLYRQAISDFLRGKTPRPEIRAHPREITTKYGFGVNLEQEMPHHVRGFARGGWNEGQHESYAYTEVDQTVEFGADLAGNTWHRRLDKVGAVLVSNGISTDHQKYLALGGQGFLLGDGALNYGRENIVEGYYNLHLWRGIFAGLEIQHITHPGYNRDRGPVLAPGFRFHLEF